MKIDKKKIYKIVFLFAILLAILVRTYLFGVVPGGMNQDGAMAAVDAKALADYGTDRFGMKYPVHLTAWGFGQMSALLSYLMVPAIRIWGLSVFSARLPMLLVSLASLGLMYLFVKDSAGERLAFVVFLLAAINPWHIIQSRWAIDCNLFPHFLLAGICLLKRGSDGKKTSLYLSMVFFALSMYCYGISIYTVPIILLFSCIMLLRRKLITFRQACFAAAVYFLLAWPFIACMIINAFGFNSIETPFFTIPYFPYSMRSGDILFFSEEPLTQLQRNAEALFQILFQIYRGPAWNEIRGFGTLYPFSVPFMLTGMVILFRHTRKNTGAALTVIWFLTAVAEGLITANVNINRINMIFYPLIIFTGTGIYAVFHICSENRILRYLRFLLPAAYLTVFCMFTFTYFTSYARQASEDFMQDFGTAVTSIKGSDAEKIYISADAQYKGFSHVSEILSLFYLDIDAKYYQSGAFHDRFTFHIPSDPDPSENAVYVAAADDMQRFPDELYNTVSYGKFLVVTPK